MHSCDREGPSCEEEGTILSKENSLPCAEEIGIHGKPAAEGCRAKAGCDVSPVSAPVEKKRFEWIDNARIVAALLIIYVHMPWFVNYEPSVNNKSRGTSCKRPHSMAEFRFSSYWGDTSLADA